jgi:phosphopantetheine--protein transferase-like protein
MIIPGEGELHLWFCRRDKALGSDGFLREVVSCYLGIAPQQLSFTRGRHGKPALASPAHPIAFNLTDSRDWTALAVSGGADIGADLEYCDRGREVLKLARRCFSPAEVDQLLACDGPQRVDCFYDHWTLKEAAIKATGGSLARELEGTGFELAYPAQESEPGVIGRITALKPAAATPAWYCLLQPFENYRLALCCIAPHDFTLGLRLFEWPCTAPRSYPQSLMAVSAPPEMFEQAACP